MASYHAPHEWEDWIDWLMELGVTLVGRLRKDAALFDPPAREKTVRRGPKRIYGKTASR